MSEYETVFRAYRSKFDSKKLFETEDEAKAYDLNCAARDLGLDPCLPINGLTSIHCAIKVLYDAIKEAETARMIAEYETRQASLSARADKAIADASPDCDRAFATAFAESDGDHKAHVERYGK